MNGQAPRTPLSNLRRSFIPPSELTSDEGVDCILRICTGSEHHVDHLVMDSVKDGKVWLNDGRAPFI